jgi:hypothetical protein
MYAPPVLVAQRQTRVSVWPCPEGTSVPLSINGRVSLVTLDQGMPLTPPWAVWGSSRYCRTDPLRPCSFSAEGPQTRAWSEDESGHSLTHTFILKLLQFSFPLLGGFPDLWNSSWKFLGVDQAPLPSSGTGPDLGLISWGWCLPSLDESARWVGPLLLGVQAGPRLLREMECHWVEGGPGIPLGGMPPHSVPCPSLLQCSLAAGWWHKGPVIWNLAGASRMLWQGSQRRNQVTLRGVENSEFYFFLHQRAQTCTCVWALNKGFTRYLKGSVGHQVTKMCSDHGVLTSEIDC